jgi:hypothetical protein
MKIVIVAVFDYEIKVVIFFEVAVAVGSVDNAKRYPSSVCQPVGLSTGQHCPQWSATSLPITCRRYFISVLSKMGVQFTTEYAGTPYWQEATR